MDDEKREWQRHSGDPEKGGLHDDGSELPYDEDEDEEGEQGMKSAVDGGPEKKGMPWRRYGSVNPFRWRQPPPVPKRRSVSKEGNASWISLITFSWIGGLMKVLIFPPLLHSITGADGCRRNITDRLSPPARNQRHSPRRAGQRDESHHR